MINSFWRPSRAYSCSAAERGELTVFAHRIKTYLFGVITINVLEIVVDPKEFLCLGIQSSTGDVLTSLEESYGIQIRTT